MKNNHDNDPTLTAKQMRRALYLSSQIAFYITPFFRTEDTLTVNWLDQLRQ